jgi:hypothetical protein
MSKAFTLRRNTLPSAKAGRRQDPVARAHSSRQMSAISWQPERLGPLLRCRSGFVDAALEELLSLRPTDVQVEPGAVTP